MSTSEGFFTRKPEYVLHPVGEWRAIFKGWKEDSHDKFGKQAKLEFETEVVGDDDEPRTMTCWTKPSLHPKGKIFQLLQGAWGIDPEAIPDAALKDGSFLTEHVGDMLRLQIAHKPKKDAPTELADQIVAFLPFKKATVKTSAKYEDSETTTTEAPTPAPPPAAPAKKKPSYDDEE